MANRFVPLLKKLLSLSRHSHRMVTYMPRPGDGAPHAVTSILGNEIVPHVNDALDCRKGREKTEGDRSDTAGE
ncbi:unnamed protein product [Linum trigynum]|uniref:Uncharacterized protein n=1 Tax=Linum trigynum TaxID=586398 RepID=A0AAV2DE88_9ROSI